MEPFFFFDLLDGLEAALSLAAFFLLVRSRSLQVYWPMLPIVGWRLIPETLLTLLRATHYLTPMSAYHLYFYTFWTCYGLAALSALLLTYTIFEEALRPLKGLQELGAIIYQWTAVVSVALGLSVFFSTDVASSNGMVAATLQLERSSAVMVLSLIAFVGLALRPLGLSARSRVFGLSLGLAFVTLFTLLQSGSVFRQRGIYSSENLIYMGANCVALSIWVYYFYVPEPKRRFILLPTTSPFHAWNQISELLGHDPGFVAIAGIPPESFAPAEIDIFGKASKNMARVAAGELPPDRPASYYINMNGERREDSYRPVDDWGAFFPGIQPKTAKIKEDHNEDEG